MKGLTRSLIGLGLLAGLAMPAVAMAGPGGQGGYGSGQGGPHMDRMAQALNLTDEQQEKMAQVRDKARPEFRKLGRQMRDNRKALFGLDPTAKDYNSKLADLARQQGKLIEQMIVLRGHVRAETDAILTPEQREQAKKLMQERRDRMKDRMRDGKRGDRSWGDRQGQDGRGPGGMSNM